MITARNIKTPYCVTITNGDTSVYSDVAKERGGEAQAFRPHEFLCAAYASCFHITLCKLLDKENLVRQVKKLLNAFFSDKITKNIVRIVKLSNSTFTNFITGQCLDACLIATLLFIVMSILKMPYALVLAVLFAITALIPYIGAFIALFVGVLLIAVTNPIMALWYVIIFFILQQIDENFTYPKIVGKSVGLPALWALLAVLIGGSIFGFIGIIISVPISSVLYSLLKDYVNYRIRKKQVKVIDNN